jgi:hypothetical protein
MPMGNFSTFYFLNFDRVFQENVPLKVDCERDSFNYLFDNEYLITKSPTESIVDSILNYSKATSFLENGSQEFVEINKN